LTRLPGMHARSLAIVLPAYNEADRLGPALDELYGYLRRRGEVAREGAPGSRRLPDRIDVVVVDDGSTDDTFATLLCAARDEPWVSVLRHHANRGLGAALRTAFANVDTPIVCTIDSDCTYPPERLPELTALIEQGADIEGKDPSTGASVLHYAVMRGNPEILKYLLGKSVDVNSRTRNGTTPLHTAVLYNRYEVAEMLLNKGADVEAKSSSGATPLAIATAARNRDMADLLRARGAITILGGPHARCFPDDACKYFDYVVGLTDRELVNPATPAVASDGSPAFTFAHALIRQQQPYTTAWVLQHRQHRPALDG